MKLKLAVIGGGFAKNVVIPSARGIPELQVAGICTRRLENATSIASQFDIPFSTDDWRKIVDQKFDLYYVGVPPLIQEDIIEQLVERGIPFLCEKPLGVNIKRLEKIVEKAGPNNPSLVDFEFTRIPSWAEAHRLVKAGEIGKVKHIEVEWKTMQYVNKQRLESWKTRVSEGGGAINVYGTHALHCMLWLGGPAESCELKLSKKPNDPRDTHTAAEASVTFLSGATGKLNLDCEFEGEACHNINITGDQGSIRLRQTGNDFLSGFKLEIETTKGTRNIQAEFTLAPGQDSRMAGLTSILKLLLQRLKDPSVSGPSLHEGLAVQKWIRNP
jgi:predicted dehydrogenase